MGYSWVLSGDVKVGRAALDGYRTTTVDPSRFADWPESWGEPGCNRPAMSVAEVIRDYETADAHQIRWTDDGVKLLALFSNDHSIWLQLRSHMAAAVRAAADFKGTAEVAITGYLDGGPSDVYRIVARADGTSEMDVLTAREAKPIASRLHAEAEPLLEAMIAGLEDRPKREPGPRTTGIATVHQRVCAALRASPARAVMEAAARETTTFIHPKKKVKNIFLDGGTTLYGLFPKANELIDALERGWVETNKHWRSTDQLPLAGLRVVALLATPEGPAMARELAKAYLAVKGRGDRHLERLHAEARVITASVDGPKKVASALAAMKKAMPKTPHFSMHHALEAHPTIRILRESKTPEVHDLVRAELVALTGADKAKLKGLSPERSVYAFALSLALEPTATPGELKMLFRLWTDSKDFVLLDHDRILRHGADGKAFLASLFGRATSSHYASQEQARAGTALLEIDETRALTAARGLLDAKTISGPHASGVEAMIEALLSRKESKGWSKLLLEITRAGSPIPSDVIDDALAVLVAWKNPKAAERVLAHFESLGVDDACALLEQTNAPATSPALKALLAALPPKARRDRNRLEQCIAHLSNGRKGTR